MDQSRSRVKENALSRAPKVALVPRSFGDDITNKGDSQEFLRGICRYLHSVQEEKCAMFGYMSQQRDVNDKMRGILVDWLIEVHLKFKLAPETLYLTINIIDRYLERRELKRTKLQLLGVTAMFIASKYEEIHAPEARDFVYITDHAYTKTGLLDMERDVLKALHYNLTVVSPYGLLEFYCEISKHDRKLRCFSQYLIELALVCYKMLQFSPSLTAAAAVYLTHKLHSVSPPWPAAMAQSSGLAESQLRLCARELYHILAAGARSGLRAVQKKFSLAAYGQVVQRNIH